MLFGRGKVQSVPAELELHQRSRALILCTTSSRPTAERVQSQAPSRIADIHQLPPTGDARERLAKLIDHAKQKDADCLLVIGGGSPIGFAKTVAANAGLRSIAVVTTYSGSEMASTWSIGAGKDRMAGDHDDCLPLTCDLRSRPDALAAAAHLGGERHERDGACGRDAVRAGHQSGGRRAGGEGGGAARVEPAARGRPARRHRRAHRRALRRLARRCLPRPGRCRACARATGAAGVRARPFALPRDLHALRHRVQRQGRAASDAS